MRTGNVGPALAAIAAGATAALSTWIGCLVLVDIGAAYWLQAVRRSSELSRSKGEDCPEKSPAGGWLLAVLLTGTILVVVGDYPGYLRAGGPSKYVLGLPLLTLTFLGLLGHFGARSPRMTASDRLLLALVTYGFGCLMVQFVLTRGAVVTGALPFLVPAAAGLAHLFVRQPPSARQVRLLLNVVGDALVAYSALLAVASVAVNSPVSLGYSYTHERAFLLAAAIVASVLRKSTWRAFLAVAAAAVAVTTYPAVTYFVVAAASLLTALMVRQASHKWAWHSLGLAAAVAVAAILADFERFVGLAGSIRSATGRVDNTQTRVDLWQQAAERVGHQPLFGQAWSGSLTGLTEIRGVVQAVPFHNDYLQLAVAGGATAVLLFAGVAVCINIQVVPKVHKLRNSSPDRWALAVTLLVLVDCGFIAAVFNPVLFNLGPALALFTAYALLRWLTGDGQLESSATGDPVRIATSTTAQRVSRA